MSNFDHFIGTRAVSEQHAFDTAALSAWLQQHLEGFVGPLSCCPRHTPSNANSPS